MGAPRFRYALQPVLLTRQWDLDNARTALAEHNAILAGRRDEHAQANGLLGAAQEEWRGLGAAAHVSIDRFTRLSHYIADRQRAADKLAADVAQLEQESVALADQVAAAQRALEAVEEHKDRMRGEFHQSLLAAEGRAGDEHWLTRRTAEEEHEYQS